jgi:transcriptional regulator with XRE-family HTH domain
MTEAETLGQRLRLRRKVKALSLQDVALRASISTGLLSQIERGLTTPSVKSLSAICAALEMPVSWLFDQPAAADAPDADIVVRRWHRRVLDLGSRGMIKELLTPDACAGIQMMRLIIRPGGATGDTPYNHPQGAKCGLVQRGILGLEINGRSLRIDAGASFAFPATAMIRFWAEGDTDCEVIWVVAPAVY